MSDIEEEFVFEEEFLDDEEDAKDVLLGSDADKSLNERMSASRQNPSVNGSFKVKTAEFDRDAANISHNSNTKSQKSVSFKGD